MARSRKHLGDQNPLAATPKFQAGQKVRISPEGVRYHLQPEGTTGVVVSCGWVTVVRIEGQGDVQYHGDFWDALDEQIVIPWNTK